MREITAALLRERLARGHLTVLDAGCGTGGFLAWAARTGSSTGWSAWTSARRRWSWQEAVPGAELHVAPVHDLPFADGSFDVGVLNDVLQHVDEREVDAGLRELRRVLRRTECCSCGRTEAVTRGGSGRTGGCTTPIR